MTARWNAICNRFRMNASASRNAPGGRGSAGRPLPRPLASALLLLAVLLLPCRSGGEPAAERHPSLESRVHKQLLGGLSGERRLKASAIVSDSLPELEALDARIDGKMEELKELTYADDADPEALARLGLELQSLRGELREKLRQVNSRLLNETGVQLKISGGRGVRSFRGLDCVAPEDE